MDVFLVGFTLDSPAFTADEFGMRLATYGHGATLIRDWSSLTDDDTRWGVVVDTPDALSIREAANEFGVEITGTIRLVPASAVRQPVVDWVATLSDVLPADPPPHLGESIPGGGGGSVINMALLPNLVPCDVCGWIGEHDPVVAHPGVP